MNCCRTAGNRSLEQTPSQASLMDPVNMGSPRAYIENSTIPVSSLVPSFHLSPHTPLQTATPQPPNMEPAVQETIEAKTQAEQDAEILTSDEWLGLQAEAASIWKARVAELREVIATLQDEKNFFSLSICAAFFGVDATGADSVFSPSFGNDVISEIEKIVSLEKYRIHMAERTVTAYNSYPRTVDYYVSEFFVQRNSFLVGALSVFTHFPENSETIQNDIDSLNAFLRGLNPEAGGIGRSKWIGHTRTYAKQKLVGMSPLDFYPESGPRYIRNHFKSELEEAGTLFVMQTLAVLNTMGKRQPQSTTQVGIEFENQLRNTLLSEIPDAVVESTPVTGDHGADLLIRIGSIRIAIQAKRYTGVVGNAAVQEIFAAKQFYDADFAMVVTSSRFTNPAKVLAEKLDVALATDADFTLKIRRLLD